MNQGACEHCLRHFSYALYHCGFGNCAYAYCNTCGRIAILDEYNENIPEGIGFKSPGRVTESVALHLSPCICGGAFHADTSPRCPHCKLVLSPEIAQSYIQANAPGTTKGWLWQRNWSGMYCIDIENRAMKDNWVNL